jgi:hypothetical protein
MQSLRLGSTIIAVASAVVIGQLSAMLAQPGQSNNMLTAAGFVVRYPDTAEKQEIFNSLPANRLVKRRRNGKLYYIYAEPGGCGCAYVGSPRAYANYQNGGFRSSDSNDRVVSEMMRDMDQEDSPEQPVRQTGWTTYSAARISDRSAACRPFPYSAKPLKPVA